MIREHYTELLRADYVQRESEGFLQLLREGERFAAGLEQDLNNAPSGAAESDARIKGLRNKLHALQANCKACHEAYRDNR